MMDRFRNSFRGLGATTLIVAALMFGGTSCKSKKKAMEAQAAAEKARQEQEAAAQREREAELQRQREADEQARRDAEAKKQAQGPAQKLDLFFNAISNSANATSANNTINEALTLFASPDTPVLIVISDENGQKDYDRPTTIRNYLNYLKDQKKNANRVGNLQFDSAGKITEVELIKGK